MLGFFFYRRNLSILVYRSPKGVQYNPEASYQKALEIGDNGNKEMTYLLHPKTFSGRTY